MTRALFVLVTLLFLACAHGQEPFRPKLTPERIERCLSDDHYGVYIEGTKCGWARITLERRGQPKPRYLATFHMTFHLTAMGDRIELHSQERSEFAVEAPYAWLGASSMERENTQSAGRLLRPGPKGLTVTSFSGGERTEQTFPAVDYTLADYLASAVWIQQGPSVDQEVHYRTLDEDDARTKLESMRVTAVREVLIDGVKTRLFDVAMSSEEEDEVGSGSLDARGLMLKALLMELVEIRLEPEELAKQIEFSADLFVSGTAKIDEPLGDPSTVTRLRVRVEGKVADSLRGGPFQTLEEVDGARVLTVDVTGDARLPAEEGDAERYLRATPDVPHDHPQVQALAKQAVGDTATPAAKVERLVHFVADYVKDAYGRDKIDLLSVIRTQEGDCTEHAKLLTALARAVGVPARDAGGLVYMGDAEKGFGPHAWNEVLLDGHWVPVDATWDEVTINATHIKTSHDGGQAERWGKLDLTLLEVQHRE